MALIAQIGPDYFDVYNSDVNGNPQPFTVPAGYTNAQVVFRANYGGDLTLAVGEINFCAKVDNNAAGVYTHVFDFTASPYSSIWAIRIGSTYSPSNFGVWVPGSGIEANLTQGSSSPGQRMAQINNTIAAHITQVKIFNSFTLGVKTTIHDDNLNLTATGPGTLLSVAPPTLPNPIETWVGDAMVTGMSVYIQPGFQTPGNTDPGGDAFIQRIEITGIGTDPY
jgi:hypothetical protein